MKLRDLLAGVPLTGGNADLNMEINSISYDSRTLEPGALFVTLSGSKTDGHRYVAQALEKGAAAILCREPPRTGSWLSTPDPRAALARVSAAWFGYPGEEMTLIGVTGTNGKTTTTYLIKAMLEGALKTRVGLIGTNRNLIGALELPAHRTTPEPYELQALLRRMADAGCTHVVMEVSSHALALDRVYGVHYAVGVFTNLTQDHLDFHKTMENYCDTKAELFRRCDTGVYNADDPWAPRLMAHATCRRLSYAEKAPADLRAEDICLEADHVSFTVVKKEEKVPVRVGIPGRFMVYNTLDVLGAALALGVPLTESAAVLAAVPHVKGRVEVVPTPGKDYTILVDYAHSPDGLENVLRSVKDFAKGRTVALFGCGGDRDKTKRPKMGKIAGDIADFVVVTADNPRTEKPADIIADILPGVEETGAPFVVMEDRIEAIHYAMDHAQSGDVIVLCGKGHETYQEINHVKYHMDEREIVAEYLAGK